MEVIKDIDVESETRLIYLPHPVLCTVRELKQRVLQSKGLTKHTSPQTPREPKTERQKERELQRTRETITERQKEQGLQRTRDNRKAESDRERPRRTAFPGRERWQNHSTFRTMQTATELMFIFFSTKTRALFTKSAKENCALFKQMSFVK